MSDTLCIDSSLIGTDRHLLIDGGYQWVTSVPPTAWHLSGNVKLHSDRCLDTVIKLNHKKFNYEPPKKFVDAMTSIVPRGTQIPWSLVMPKQEHRAFTKKLINDAIESIETLSLIYYMNTWVPQSTILRSLVPAMVSHTRYNEIMASSASNSRVVEGFCPNSKGYAQIVDYDRFGTRTGRHVVATGPSILLIKKEYRDMIIPSVSGGKIIYVDFAALEARILLYEAGMRCENPDMYTHISNQLFGGSVSRNAVKLAVISELYGSGKKLLGERLEISGEELDNFVSKMKGFFQTSELRKRIKDEFLSSGHITNRYGRIIQIDEPLDHIFVNSFAQSTGVDVCLLGFSELVKTFRDRPGIRPLFVQHDALILDVGPQDIDFVMNINSVKVPGYVQRFPLKSEMK